MKRRTNKRDRATKGIPLWLSIAIDAFIVSIPYLIRKVEKLIHHIGGK